MHCQLTRAIQIAMVELLLEKWESKSSTTTPEVDEFCVD
jgi:hypothetical protein